MECLVTRLDMVLELWKFMAMVVVHGGESGGDLVCAALSASTAYFWSSSAVGILYGCRPADVHQDGLCPPNKRYALMDANKKVDLENPKSKGVVGMKIPDWMITDEMKLTKNYQLYDEVFRLDVPMT
ncbi:hypothetical protein Tco_1002177 [Tanacetum coccineum]|uniref:Uncharacterized protein n=1 Tax=Tanacetum coccineum TaxID=301880 RepID=A0ABQ5F6F6_9ASTR